MAPNKQTSLIAEPGKQEFLIIREFDVPRAAVFSAFIDPDLLVQWFLPKEFNMKIDFMNATKGGLYRNTHSHGNGTEFGFFGVFHEVSVPELIIKTSEFEGIPVKGHVVLETTLFEVLPENRTRVTIHSVCKSVAHRDAMVGSGMASVLIITHQQLDELLTNID